MFFNEIQELSEGQVVVFVENNHKMERLEASLLELTDDIYTFPVGDIMIETMATESPEFRKARMNTLYALIEKKP
ncbi:hypothetical protein ACFQY0_21375, partial [Haloferula chungangensis]